MRKFAFLFALFLFASSSGCAGEAGKAENPFPSRRLAMVERQIAARGVKDKRTLEAMRSVPRHEFVPEKLAEYAYEDYPLPIGLDQTISQPYIVALMTEAVELKPKDRVLEIGTGSGYQAAVLAEVAGEVYTIEILPELAKKAEKTLRRLGYKDIHVKAGDGFLGWAEAAPFNAIIVTAAPPEIPPPLLEQLAEGGRLVIPVGENYQELILARKKKGKITRKPIIPVRFVPMTGENAEKMKKRGE